MDEVRIRKLLTPHVGYLQEYALVELNRSDLDVNRCLHLIEAHGITSQQRLSERLFVCRGGAVWELNPKPAVTRRKTYGATESYDEPGEPILRLLDGKEEWVAIVSSAFVTKPKGPHAAEKKIELYR